MENIKFKKLVFNTIIILLLSIAVQFQVKAGKNINSHLLVSEELQIRDIYSLEASNINYLDKKQFGYIVFIYRELARGCDSKIFECRRLALAWVLPSGDIYELSIPESQFAFGVLNYDFDGIGLGENNSFSLKVPSEYVDTLGSTISLLTSAVERNKLIIYSENGLVSLEFKRTFTDEMYGNDKVNLKAKINQRFRGLTEYGPAYITPVNNEEYALSSFFTRQLTSNKCDELLNKGNLFKSELVDEIYKKIRSRPFSAFSKTILKPIP